ncbi:MAG: SH3 domain-containing protein [bacterium]|nr:SH3 domain-containing protein [bacterium]
MAALMAAACGGGDSGSTVAQTIPTDTLAPIVTLTPRYTATLIPTRTPSRTVTPIPSETPIPPTATVSPTATPTPPITGSVFSVQAINMRTGPGLDFDAVVALPPGTGFVILGTNNEGTWYNIRLDSGDEGWVSSTLVRLQNTATPFPSLTPSPDLTRLAQGSPLPTSILGGGTITPTPPRSVVTPTTVQTDVPMIAVATSTEGGGIRLPNIDAINQTATALVGGVMLPTNPPATAAGGPTGGPILTGTATTSAPGSVSANPSARQGVDVLAYCDNPVFGEPPPRDLSSGATIDVWWRWIASTQEQVQQHIDNAIYTVTLDGVTLDAYRQYRTSIRQRADGQYEVDWLVPSPPLPSGTHTITYNVTWRTAISDGVQQFGPGTATVSERGTCTFVVQ